MNATTAKLPVCLDRFATRPEAVKAARAALIAHGIEKPLSGVHFHVDPITGPADDVVGYSWAAVDTAPATPDAARSAAINRMVRETKAKTVRTPKEPAPAKAAKAADPDLIVDGVSYPNKTRANEARRLAAAAASGQPSATQVAKAVLASTGKRAAVVAAAAAGQLPPKPEFPSPNDKRYLPLRDRLVALAEAGDVAGLKAVEIKTYSSSPKKLDKYRNLCVTALEGRAQVAA